MTGTDFESQVYAHWNHYDITPDGACPAFPGGMEACTWDKEDNGMHVYYRGTDQHVHELYRFDNWPTGSPWSHRDLHETVGGSEAVASRVTARAWDGDRGMHLFYVGRDDHVHQLFCQPSKTGLIWRKFDPTAATNAPKAVGQPVACAWDGGDKGLHVFYAGQVRGGYDLHQLYYHQEIGWRHCDISAAAGVAEKGPVLSRAAACAWDGDKGMHVFYRGPDDHIHQLFYHLSESRWNHLDISEAAGAPVLCRIGPTACAWDVDKGMHVFYLGNDRHIHQLYYHQGSGWHHYDVSSATGAQSAHDYTDPIACTWNQDMGLRVFYLGTDTLYHELGYTPATNWRHALVDSPKASDYNNGYPAVCTWNADKGIHLFYDRDGRIHELRGTT